MKPRQVLKALTMTIVLVAALVFTSLQPDMKPIFVNLGQNGLTIQTK